MNTNNQRMTRLLLLIMFFGRSSIWNTFSFHPISKRITNIRPVVLSPAGAKYSWSQTSTSINSNKFRKIPCSCLYSSSSQHSSKENNTLPLMTKLSPTTSSTNLKNATTTTTTTTKIYQGKRNLQNVLHIAEKASHEAGIIMRQTCGLIPVHKTKSNNIADLVTQSDLECQTTIKKIIKEAFPNDLFFGEEVLDDDDDVIHTSDKSAASSLNDYILGLQKSYSGSSSTVDDDNHEKLLWIVDPIDGTTNFQAGLPLFCVSIGVVSLSVETLNPQVIAGVIYNPILDERISAVYGMGCYLNGEKISSQPDSCNSKIPLNKALINVGYPISSPSTLEVSSKAVKALSTKVRGIRMIASASQVMSWVAQCKFNAYVSWNLNAWDVAAGMIIVEESGGTIINLDGTDADIYSRDMIICCREGDKVEDGTNSLRYTLLKVLEDNDCINYVL